MMLCKFHWTESV